jgi:hypothetical protein
MGTAKSLPTVPPAELIQSQTIAPTIDTLGSQESREPALPEPELLSTSLGAGPRNRIYAHVRCPAADGRCQGTIALRTRSAVRLSGGGAGSVHKTPAIVTVAAGSFDLTGGRLATVRLDVSASGLSLLRRTHLLSARATLIAHDRTGTSHIIVTLVNVRAMNVKRVRPKAFGSG